MEKKKIMMMAVTLFFALGTFFLAQSSSLAAGQEGKAVKSSQMSTERMGSMNSIRMSKLMGKEVMNQQDEKLGELKDVVFDTSGRNAYLIVEHGGVLGIGEKYTAVPWEQASFREKNGGLTAVLNISKDKFAQAPNFSGSQWPDFASKDWEDKINTYYGEGGQPGRQQRSPTKMERKPESKD